MLSTGNSFFLRSCGLDTACTLYNSTINSYRPVVSGGAEAETFVPRLDTRLREDPPKRAHQRFLDEDDERHKPLGISKLASKHQQQATHQQRKIRGHGHGSAWRIPTKHLERAGANHSNRIMWSDLMESGNKPDAEEAGELLANFDRYCQKAARALAEADVFLLVTGAGFSADSGLAIYRDVAKVPAYQARDLDYSDICMPHWQFDDPELFYGFWGQCFNDYRKTQPHEGYSILHRWKQDKNFDNNNVAETISARIERKVELQRPFDDEIVERHAPYLVKSGPAGSFFSFTSNVDAHLHDLFEAHEIHECHGNIESWQCSDPYCDAGVFRAPLDHSFEIDMETMLAPSVQGDTSSSSKNDTATQAGKKSSNSNHVPHIGQVGGSNRTQPLQKMPPPKEPNNWRTSTSIATDSEGNDVFPNWPQCALCKAYARPAILMFGDARWKRDIAQGERWNLWKETVLDLCEKRNSNNPLKVCIVEVGCGLNVPTCRFASERMVEDVARKGGDVVLVRVNPDFPLASDSDVNDCVIPIMARGLDAIKRIDKHYRGM